MEETVPETSVSAGDDSVRRGRVSAIERPGLSSELNLEHYWLLLWHRKWIALGIFVTIALGTAAISYRLPNVYTSETLILVDPQKVPDSYVKPTVTGDVRDRLGTLSQQILSATRLQTVIDSFNLYSEEKEKLAREEIISRMRKDIGVSLVSDFGAGQGLEAFKISYSGKDPRTVAEVTNELASLFIEENLKAREQQATGTSDFLENQLEETKKELEEQEAKLRDFKLKHIGEMPDQQTATLGIYGQLQSQLRSEEEALGRAEQQRSYLQSLMAQSAAPVVDLDPPNRASSTPSSSLEAKLSALLSRYGENYPDVQRLKDEIAKSKAQVAAQPAPEPDSTPTSTSTPVVNPILKSQLSAVDAEIAKHKAEQERLTQLVSGYRAKLEAVPLREQEVADLERDYDISKEHYGQLLDKKLSADTAAQLEVRQKGEKFTILDPAQVAEKPSSPNRMLIDVAGVLVGLALGLSSTFVMDFFGMSITSVAQLNSAADIPVLGVVPIIRTPFDRQRRKRWILAGGASGLTAIVVIGTFLLYHYGHF